MDVEAAGMSALPPEADMSAGEPATGYVSGR